MLGIGLHAYGFMDSALFWLGSFLLSQLIFIALGLLPAPGGAGARGRGFTVTASKRA